MLDAGEPTRVDELWVGDITYLPLRGGGFGYLAALLDRYSRDIVAWSIDSTMAESLVLGVLRRAIRERQPMAGLVHHTRIAAASTQALSIELCCVVPR